MAVRQYIGARYVPKFYEGSNGSAWDSGVMYESLTIVGYLTNYYVSKKTVPSTVGAPNLNPEYWANIGLLGNLENRINEVDAKVDALDLSTDGRLDAIEADIDKLPVSEESNVLFVGEKGAQFDSINGAITYAKTYCSYNNRVVICILPGEYNESINLFPNPGIDLVGLGRCVVKSSATYPEAALYTIGDGFFYGITFMETGGDSDAIHIEAQNNQGNLGNIIVRNCTASCSTGRPAVGVGMGVGELLFDNCVFSSGNAYGLYVHNNPNGSALGSSYLKVFDCDLSGDNLGFAIENVETSVPGYMNVTALRNYISYGAFGYVVGAVIKYYIPTGEHIELAGGSFGNNVNGLNAASDIITIGGYYYAQESFLGSGGIINLPCHNANAYDWTVTHVEVVASSTDVTASVTLNTVNKENVVLSDNSGQTAGTLMEYTLTGTAKATTV